MTPPKFETLLYDLQDGVATITLNRPEALNSFTGTMHRELAEALDRVVDRAVQICGGLGISEDIPVSRLYREIRAFRIYDGPSEVHRHSIARRVLRRAAATEGGSQR